MRVAVTFCNQRLTPSLGLVVVDEQIGWVPLPSDVRRATGATGMTFHHGRLVVAVQGGGAILASYAPDWDCQVIRLSEPRDLHDLHSDGGELLIASSGDDRVWRANGAQTALWEASGLDRDEHHVNGLTSEDGRVLVSTFGAKRDRPWSQVTEGRVLDLDGRTVLEGLHHPHSPRLRDGQLWVCDSGRGELVLMEEGRQARVSIGGYTRGLWIDENLVVVGVSAARSRSRSEGTTNVATDAGSWSGMAIVDRHGLAVLDRIDLTGLGGEVFDVAAVHGFAAAPGGDAHRERCLLLVELIARMEPADQSAG